jgi:proteic killer suppression protein
MIRTFRDARTEAFFRGVNVRAFRGFEARALKRLLWLHAAFTLQDLRNIRSNRLEAPPGNRRGQRRTRINRQWCICFRWHKGDALDVGIVAYHQEKKTWVEKF